MEPANVTGWFVLGEALTGLRDLSGAEGALRRVLELEPSHGRACHLLGRVFDRSGRSEEAEMPTIGSPSPAETRAISSASS